MKHMKIFILQLLDVHYQAPKMFDNSPKFLGCIREKPVFFKRKHLEVWNKDNEKIYDISGPCCPVSCGGEIPFQVDN